MEITEKLKTEITAKLDTFVERIGSQNRAAQMLGVSAAYLSSIRSGKWEKIADKTWRLLGKQLLSRDWKLVRTANFDTIQATCLDCQDNGLTRFITGYSGAGKTTALRHYAREARDVIYVHCLDGTTRKQFLRDVLTAMGVEYEGNERQLLDRVRREFLAMEAPLLILDDAGKLPLRLLQKVQQVYDLTRSETGEGNLGIILAGVDYAYDNLKKWALRERAGAPELRRRIGYNQQLSRPSKKEVSAVASKNGIEEDGVINDLWRHCKDFGSLAEAIRNIQRLPDDADIQEAIGGKEVAYA